MDAQKLPEPFDPLGERKCLVLPSEKMPVFADTYGGRVRLEWDRQAPVTPLGQLPFFIDFLKTAELYSAWIADCPLSYTSNNAPKKADVLGTLFLSVLAGHQRYARIETIRMDSVNPPLLGMTKVVSVCSARRAFSGADRAACGQWLQAHLHRSYKPLLYTPWILDVDTHIKTLYGHQEGARVGYNPKKPGRPSHVLHTYFMANTRLVLDVEVRPGNETASKYTMPALGAFLDRLPPNARPFFVRGDCAFGNEGVMVEAEARGIRYLFKLRQTSGVQKLIGQVFSRPDWAKAGQGWEGVEAYLQLQGWSKKRRVIVLRREIKEAVAVVESGPLELGEQQLQLIQSETGIRRYEYAVLITTLEDEIITVAQHYRERGDAENNYDETTNHWGWGGYTTHDLTRCEIMARLIALAYNWWSLYVRLAIPERHAEVITSRPLLLYGVGVQTRHAGQTTITVTSTHTQAQSVERVVRSILDFLSEIKATAGQLSWQERWRTILSRAFAKLLGGKPLASPDLLPAPG